MTYQSAYYRVCVEAHTVEQLTLVLYVVQFRMRPLEGSKGNAQACVEVHHIEPA